MTQCFVACPLRNSGGGQSAPVDAENWWLRTSYWHQESLRLGEFFLIPVKSQEMLQAEMLSR